MTRLGVTNAKWGVCGFTSSFYAMYDLNPAARPNVINATSAFTVLAEIKTYLALLKAANSPLLKEIRDFTRSFGGFEQFSIDDYIANVNQAVDKSRSQVLADAKFSIALPPASVADYVRRIWGWKASVSEADPGGDGIIGVSSGRSTGFLSLFRKPYNGLEHYMYRHGSTIYSWGQSFGSVRAAALGGAGGAPWSVCYLVSVTRP
jgi:hypothetical protein